MLINCSAFIECNPFISTLVMVLISWSIPGGGRPRRKSSAAEDRRCKRMVRDREEMMWSRIPAGKSVVVDIVVAVWLLMWRCLFGVLMRLILVLVLCDGVGERGNEGGVCGGSKGKGVLVVVVGWCTQDLSFSKKNFSVAADFSEPSSTHFFLPLDSLSNPFPQVSTLIYPITLTPILFPLSPPNHSPRNLKIKDKIQPQNIATQPSLPNRTNIH